MKRTMSIGKKLMLISAVLVLVPMLVIGTITYGSLRQFGSHTAEQTSAAMEKMSKQAMMTGSQNDRTAIEEFLTRMEVDGQKLAKSRAFNDYFNAQAGRSDVWGDITQQQVQTVVEGIVKLCQTQQASLDKVLTHNLKVAEHIFTEAGTVGVSSEEHTWTAVNQFTKEKQETKLPVLKVGNIVLTPNTSIDVKTPVVDDVAALVGGVCTIFQRMNEQGDMIRVATNVQTADKTRAVGTYIPAVNPDGKPNPVMSVVAKGETYVGRAFVVDSWYVTAYQPIKDAGGKINGMLFVGIKERENNDLANSITSIKIGKQGYPFVMDSQGTLIVHPKADYVGKNTITDLKINEFKDLLVSKDAGNVKHTQYVFEGRKKHVAYYYFPKWDWIICGSTSLDDMSSIAVDSSMKYLTQEMKYLYQLSLIRLGEENKPLYSQIRMLDEKGNEVIVVKNGELTDKLGTRANTEWFQKAVTLKPGSSYVTRVEIAQNTGEPEIRLAIPVYHENQVKGVIALNVDWNLTKGIFAGHVYGKTGYPYIIDDTGLLITHPKYSVKDKFSIADEKQGNLASIVKDEMLKGKEGISRYTFEGVDKIVTFVPMKLGEFRYTVAATCPFNELMEMAEAIKAQTQTQLGKTITILSIIITILATVGTIIGFWTSRKITIPLRRIITKLTDGSQRISSASGEISSSSQSLAEGATEQAAGLEETSSSLEEMSSMTKQNADNAQQANTLASQARKAADDGSQAMSRMNTAIHEIQKSSDETAKIIKVIDEIAFQTNLLALNAAVEAARAGEAGKGFAVVAEEVRNLAMRSAEAAKNTSNLIEQSVNNSRNGVQICSEVKKSLDEIVGSIGKTTDLVGEIAAASREQAQGVDQINTAVSQMDKVTQQNAANAEESASASEELSSQAESMNQIVDQLVALVNGLSEKEAVTRTTAACKTERKGHPVTRLDHTFHQVAAGTGPKEHIAKPKEHTAECGQNCWESKKCGRIPGGNKIGEFGICPAYPDHGKDCWAVAGTFCGGKVQASVGDKIGGCMVCNFYKELHSTTHSVLS
jgi:methyl-accepting chemotaxis protein